MSSISLFVRLSRPFFLLGAVLLYALGAGIARYLGVTLDWNLYLIGQAWVTLLQLSTHYFNEYFDAPADADNPNRTSFSGGSGALGPGKLPRAVALWAGLVCLTIVASLSVILLSANHSPGLLVIMILAFLGAFLYSMPPIRLATTGYGELTTSIVVSNLVPALAFILQTGEMHRLLAMSTFPLTALNLAMILAFELPDYGSDLKHTKRTLMVRIGWQSAMTLHNFLILAAFVILGIAAMLGLPLAIALPAFLPLGLGLFQIWMMNRIAQGGKPNWNALTLNAIAVYSVTAYLLTFAFWTR